MANQKKSELQQQNFPFDRRHILLYLLIVVGLPLLTHHLLQYLYVALARTVSSFLYIETAQTVLSLLLGCFDVLINFLKSIAVFAALGLLAARMVYAYGSRLTKIGVSLLPLALLLPYLASYWLTAVFQHLSAKQAWYHTLNIVLNLLLDLTVVGLGVLVLSFRRSKIWQREETDPKEAWLPRKSNYCLRSLLYVTLTSLAVRFVVSVVDTVNSLVTVGAPQNFSEVFTLLFPYLLLCAQHLVGYLVMAQMVRTSARIQPPTEKAFVRTWALKKK